MHVFRLWGLWTLRIGLDVHYNHATTLADGAHFGQIVIPNLTEKDPIRFRQYLSRDLFDYSEGLHPMSLLDPVGSQWNVIQFFVMVKIEKLLTSDGWKSLDPRTHWMQKAHWVQWFYIGCN